MTHYITFVDGVEQGAQNCRGPAPADPGYSKERRLGEGQGITA